MSIATMIMNRLTKAKGKINKSVSHIGQQTCEIIIMNSSRIGISYSVQNDCSRD
uniref:Uncharacterized protein n=1 Tax=Rhizophora mucronata TaxID=61149 RepID=A0A2P2J4N1_RHIMU